MAITAISDSATIGTSRYYLSADSTVKSLSTLARRVQVTVRWDQLAEGDTFRVDIHRVIGATEITQTWGFAVGPAPDPTDIEMNGLPAGWDVSVTKVAGTDRSIGWTISYEAVNLADLATPADVLTTALTEAYAADGAAPTLSEAVFAIQQFLQERAVSGTTLTVKKLDGSTTAQTFTHNDASAPTTITRAS